MIGAGNTIKKDGILFLWKFIAEALIENHISFKDNLSQTDFSGSISFSLRFRRLTYTRHCCSRHFSRIKLYMLFVTEYQRPFQFPRLERKDHENGRTWRRPSSCCNLILSAVSASSFSAANVDVECSSAKSAVSSLNCGKEGTRK
jgi:hypothetical protein